MNFNIHFKFALLFISQTLSAQTFNANISSAINLAGANGSCGSPGSGVNVVEIIVSGVGVLNSTNALNLISVTLSNSCKAGSVNIRDVAYRIMAPDGTCAGVYNGGLTTSAIGSHTINLVSPQSCLRNPNTANGTGGSEGVSGNYGYFNAQFGGIGTNLTTVFNGVNADGIWKIIFSESTSFEPCLEAASIRFGDPTTANELGNGNLCSNPIIYSGGALCAETDGMTGEINSPGSNTGQGDLTLSTFANGSCEWNANNNNDVWIRFVATANPFCINISSTSQSLQSIVVSHPTGDGSACPANGEGWNLISCPRSSIYTTTSGTQNNQQHCFTTTVGNTYYLVVDGNGGAESPFYVSGTQSPNPFFSVEWLNIKVIPQDLGNLLEWATDSELNNKEFVLERSADAAEFFPIGEVSGKGTVSERSYYSFTDYTAPAGISYYRLKQTDFDGQFSYSDIVTAERAYIDQPAVFVQQGNLYIKSNKAYEEPIIMIYNSAGVPVLQDKGNSTDVSRMGKGIYVVRLLYQESHYLTRIIIP